MGGVLREAVQKRHAEFGTKGRGMGWRTILRPHLVHDAVAALAAAGGSHRVAGVALHADLAMQHACFGLGEASHEPATVSPYLSAPQPTCDREASVEAPSPDGRACG